MKRILLTGSSGKLGSAIVASGLFSHLLTPSHSELDIIKEDSIKSYFSAKTFDAIINCAALARMRECHEHPDAAIQTNIVGTSQLVCQTIQKEQRDKKSIRFIHMSTDGVYPGIRGNYNEQSETMPYNLYGWTKLGSESAIKALSNHCIVRTSFFDPASITFPDAATDAYSSRIPIGELVKAIALLLENPYVGTINVGSKRRSEFEHYREFKPHIKATTHEQIQATVPFTLARDASMDITLWEKIKSTHR